VKSIGVKCRGNAANVRLALESGKVAGSVDPYHTGACRRQLHAYHRPTGGNHVVSAAEQNGVTLEITAR